MTLTSILKKLSIDTDQGMERLSEYIQNKKTGTDLDMQGKIGIYSVDVYKNSESAIKFKFKGILFKEKGLDLYKVLNGTDTWIAHDPSSSRVYTYKFYNESEMYAAECFKKLKTV
jgi:hypothetical protein